MKYVMDNFKLKKRVRLILGLDEERNWESINYYKQKEEAPAISFSPDADFPCIYAEKTVVSSCLNYNYSKSTDDAFFIKDFSTQNNALNVVPKFCSCTLEVNTSQCNLTNFLIYLNSILITKYPTISLKVSDNVLFITSQGKNAHGCHPELGINAISPLLNLIFDLCNRFDFSIPIVDYFSNNLSTNYTGALLNIDFNDFSGKLTLNVGSVLLANGVISIGLNIRVPVTYHHSLLESHFIHSLTNYPNVTYVTKKITPSLNVDQNSYLVSTLCDIFNEATSGNYKPISIGGATYARAFDNSISFGPTLPGQKDMCHQTDEFIPIEQLIFCSKIYSKAILELAKEETI